MSATIRRPFEEGAGLPCSKCHAGRHALCTGALDYDGLDGRCACQPTPHHRRRLIWEAQDLRRLRNLPRGLRAQKIRREEKDQR